MALETIDNLALIYKPIIYLHPHERHYPLNIRAYLQSANVIDNNTKALIREGPITNLLLDQEADTYSGSPTFIIRETEQNDVKRGEWATHDANLYYRAITIAGKIYITFIAFFGYNGDYPVFYNLFPMGSHWSDFEHITLEFDETTQTLLRAYYGAHKINEGRWVLAEDIEMKQVTPGGIPRPVVHVAKIGHGFYPQPGSYIRFGGFANDLCSKSEMSDLTQWDSRYLIRLFEPTEPEYLPESHGFLKYNGTWGEGKISGPQQTPWWSAPQSQTDDAAPGRSTFDLESQDLVVGSLVAVIVISVGIWAIVMVTKSRTSRLPSNTLSNRANQ